VDEDRAARRPQTSNADDWQLWLIERVGLQDETGNGCAFLGVQIVEAIEEHQKALAREVYGLAEDTAARFSDLASEDTPEGHYARGAIHQAKSIARAINAIMPYSRDPAALERQKGEVMTPDKNINQAVSATEAVAALREWLEAHGAMVHFLLRGQDGDADRAQWDAAHRVISKRQSDAIERAIAIVDAAKKHGTRE